MIITPEYDSRTGRYFLATVRDKNGRLIVAEGVTRKEARTHAFVHLNANNYAHIHVFQEQAK